MGFPGETEEDFLQTLQVVEQVRFTGAYTFQYSKRPGTPAATMDNQISKEVVQDRYERLVSVVNQIAWEENLKLVGSEVEVLVAQGEGRKDRNTNRLSGRAADGRLVHLNMGDAVARPGDFVNGVIVSAAPHHLVADHRATRPTKAGDLGAERPQGSAVMLGIPSLVQ